MASQKCAARAETVGESVDKPVSPAATRGFATEIAFRRSGSMAKKLRIASYNINGITTRLEVLLRWLSEFQPDVACLQELKTPVD